MKGTSIMYHTQVFFYSYHESGYVQLLTVKVANLSLLNSIFSVILTCTSNNKPVFSLHCMVYIYTCTIYLQYVQVYTCIHMCIYVYWWYIRSTFTYMYLCKLVYTTLYITNCMFSLFCCIATGMLVYNSSCIIYVLIFLLCNVIILATYIILYLYTYKVTRKCDLKSCCILSNVLCCRHRFSI